MGWRPKSQGALYIYDKFVGPTLSKHEGSIDRKIEDVQAKLGDWCFTYSRMAYAYVQKMTLQLLQSLPTAQAAMAQQAGGTGANGATAAASQPVNPIKKNRSRLKPSKSEFKRCSRGRVCPKSEKTRPE